MPTADRGPRPTAAADRGAAPASPARSGRRAAQVVEVFARQGFSAELAALGLPGGGRRPDRHAARGRRLRDALAELGPTFVKLGQFLSTRADLLPPELVAELAPLQDDVPPVAAAVVREAVHEALGRPVEQLFAAFEDEPVAAASVAQVHGARREDGRDVVVKVRRPGIDGTIEADLALLGRLARLLARRWDQADRYDPVGVVDELGRSLRRELDFVVEGRNAEAIAGALAGHPRLHVPSVHWDRTATTVLTLERVSGTKVDDLDVLRAAGVDLPALARDIVDAALTMLFGDGVFHADLHPGNLLVEADGRIALLDFGMVGQLSGPMRAGLGAVLVGVVAQAPAAVASGLADLGIDTAPAPGASVPGRAAGVPLEDDMAGLLARYRDVSLDELSVGALLEELATVARRHALRLPTELLLLTKTIAQCESLAARLDPRFRLLPSLAARAPALLAGSRAPAQLDG